jgi:hypothetical protein
MSQTATKEIHIFVEVEPDKEPVRVEFETGEVTGREIKERAGVPLQDDLAIRRGKKLDLVTNDEKIAIKDGEHFVSLPPGTIS